MSSYPDPDLVPPRRTRIGPVVAAVPGLTRVAGAAYVNAVGWGVRTSWRSGQRVVRALSAAGESIGESIGVALDHADEPGTDRPTVPLTLRERGAELLERSRDVWSNDQGHPAYARILDELAPDEGRILLLLLQGGPQPSVDVRTGGPVGRMNSQLIAPGLSMIGMRAGVRYDDQVPAYLNNLFRLGLVWFSKEALRDPQEYQVLEAQPDVLAAMHSVKFAKVVRRSFHLTPFGEGFCRTCLVSEEEAAGAVFPEHADPGESEAAVPPTV
jgi:hypothetical protein